MYESIVSVAPVMSNFNAGCTTNSHDLFIVEAFAFYNKNVRIKKNKKKISRRW